MGATHIFINMFRISVMCMIVFVNARTSRRYMVERRSAAAVTSKSRYTVLWLRETEVPVWSLPRPPPRPPDLTHWEMAMPETATKPRN